MTTFETMWKKLSQSKSYREEFALAMLKRMVPFQIGAIRKKREMSQKELAHASNLTQGVISRAEDPDYGNLTLNTIGRIAAGFDLAFVGQFVPFSDLVRFTEDLSENKFSNLPTFGKENELAGIAQNVWATGRGQHSTKKEKKLVDAGIRELTEQGQCTALLGKRQLLKESFIPQDCQNLAEKNAAVGEAYK